MPNQMLPQSAAPVANCGFTAARTAAACGLNISEAHFGPDRPKHRRASPRALVSSDRRAFEAGDQYLRADFLVPDRS
jgi:hypothetical protein